MWLRKRYWNDNILLQLIGTYWNNLLHLFLFHYSIWLPIFNLNKTLRISRFQLNAAIESVMEIRLFLKYNLSYSLFLFQLIFYCTMCMLSSSYFHLITLPLEICLSLQNQPKENHIADLYSNFFQFSVQAELANVFSLCGMIKKYSKSNLTSRAWEHYK